MAKKACKCSKRRVVRKKTAKKVVRRSRRKARK